MTRRDWVGVMSGALTRPTCVGLAAGRFSNPHHEAQRITIPEEYILEPLPHLPGMARIIGKQTEEGILWAER